MIKREQAVEIVDRLTENVALELVQVQFVKLHRTEAFRSNQNFQQFVRYVESEIDQRRRKAS